MESTRKKQHCRFFLTAVRLLISMNFIFITPMIYSTEYSQKTIDLTLPHSTLPAAKGGKSVEGTSKKKRAATYKDMSYEELEITKNKLIASGNTDAAVKYIEQMIRLCPDAGVRGELELEVADIFFQNGVFKKAAIAYAGFVALYRGHEKIEFALHRGIVSAWECSLSYDRDQTKTEETIALATAYLSDTTFFQYRYEVEAIREQCYVKIAHNELYICDFYIKRNNVKAVSRRLTTVREKWLPVAPSITGTLLEREIQVAALQQDDELLALKRAQHAEYCVAAGIDGAQESAVRMVDRF